MHPAVPAGSSISGEIWVVKHMARLIDADALEFKFENGYDNNGILLVPYRDIKKAIEAAKTVDVVPSALFDDLRKHLCETCMDEIYGNCASCRWSKYRKDGD